MADKAGVTRSSIVAEAFAMLWKVRKNNEDKDL